MTREEALARQAAAQKRREDAQKARDDRKEANRQAAEQRRIDNIAQAPYRNCLRNKEKCERDKARRIADCRKDPTNLMCTGNERHMVCPPCTPPPTPGSGNPGPQPMA